MANGNKLYFCGASNTYVSVSIFTAAFISFYYILLKVPLFGNAKYLFQILITEHKLQINMGVEEFTFCNVNLCLRF